MNCDGCKSLRFCHGKFECVYTRIGIKELNKCPCKECLLKIICQESCPEFASAARASRDVMYYPFKPNS
jgi:hypothetical protein